MADTVPSVISRAVDVRGILVVRSGPAREITALGNGLDVYRAGQGISRGVS